MLKTIGLSHLQLLCVLINNASRTMNSHKIIRIKFPN